MWLLLQESSMQRACAMSSEAYPAVQYFSTSCKGHDKKLSNLCFLVFSPTFVWNISHSKKSARCDKRIWIVLSVLYPLLLSDFNETRIFSTDFLKILKCQISWKSVQWGASCSMRTDRLRKLIVTFRNFANLPKNDEHFTRGFSCVSARSAEVTNVERLSG